MIIEQKSHPAANIPFVKHILFRFCVAHFFPFSFSQTVSITWHYMYTSIFYPYYFVKHPFYWEVSPLSLELFWCNLSRLPWQNKFKKLLNSKENCHPVSSHQMQIFVYVFFCCFNIWTFALSNCNWVLFGLAKAKL